MVFAVILFVSIAYRMVESQTSMLESVPQIGEVLEYEDLVSNCVSPSKIALTSEVIQEASEYTRSSVSLSTHGAGDTAAASDLKLSGQDRSHSPNSEPG